MSGLVMTPDEVVGAAIRRLREASGMTQRELGERLALSGARAAWQSGVAALEKGSRHVGIDDLFAVARIFEVPIQALWVVPGSRRVVAVGDHTLSAKEWHGALRVTPDDQSHFASLRMPQGKERRRAEFIRLARRVIREKREASLATRVKFPGPTFVADRKVVVPVEIGGFGPVPLELRPNEPWVARDRPEREALLKEAARGRIRRITRSEARRLRQQHLRGER